MENGDKLFKIRFRFPGGEEFEAEGNREFIEQQRNYFLALIGKKASGTAISVTPKLNAASSNSFDLFTPQEASSSKPPLPALSALPPAQRTPSKAIPPSPGFSKEEAFPALRLWERLLKEDGDIVVLRRKMRLTAQEGALLLLAGARVLLKKPSWSALHLSRAMRKSGFAEGRLDRLLSSDIKNGHMTSEGSKRSRSYRLTNEGFAKAYVLAEKLGEESL